MNKHFKKAEELAAILEAAGDACDPKMIDEWLENLFVGCYQTGIKDACIRGTIGFVAGAAIVLVWNSDYVQNKIHKAKNRKMAKQLADAMQKNVKKAEQNRDVQIQGFMRED